jgi:tRNA(Ile)-lysidine synthase
VNSRSIEIDIVFSTEALGRFLTDDLRLPANTRFVVAYSGGLDSHVLLHALHRLSLEAGYRLRAVHVHHGLQPDADAWARHCDQVCAGLGVPCAVERVRVEGAAEDGLEAAARRARYACLARLLEPGEVLLTAHHQDDQAETVLLQLLRGAGVRGLAGMPSLAPFAGGFHARPLLGFPRAALLAYAQAQGLTWVEDPSNTVSDIDRNRLRHRLLPLMRERWPAADRQLAQAARHAAEAAALLDELAAIDLKDCLGNDGGLRVSGLRRLPPARARNLLRHWIRSQGFRVPSTKQLTWLQAQLGDDPETRHATIRWRNAELRRYRDTLVLRNSMAAPAAGRIDWDGLKPLALPGTGWQMRLAPVQGRGLARERLHRAVYSVGFRQGGETCRLPGRGHRHKLKKLLQEAGVPPWERGRLPLLYVQDELAAIGDRWVCEPFAAKSDEPGLAVVLEPVVLVGQR